MADLEITYVYMWGRKRLCGHTNSENEKEEYENFFQFSLLKAPVLLRSLELKRVVSICCANQSTLALTAYGQTLYWRYNVPQPMEELNDVFVTKIAATTPGDYEDQFMALDRNGEVYCWEPRHKQSFKKIDLPSPTITIACGDGWCLALTKEGMVFSWTVSTPITIPLVNLSPLQLGSRVVHLSAGKRGFGAALTADHNLYTWAVFSSPSGGNFLGHGKNFAGLNSGPILVEKLKNRVAYFSCGYIHMMAVTLDGEVYGWGDGDSNRLGHGLPYPERHRDEPTLIKELCGKNIKKLSLARGNEGALTENGDVYLWGARDFGGHHCFEIPTKLHMDTLEMQEATIRDISCGKTHTAIITTVSMTLKHLCFRTISLSLEKFPNCAEILPLELREAMGNFLSDRLILDSLSIQRLGLDPAVFSCNSNI